VARRPIDARTAIGGADPAAARLWPLSVDGLLLLASIGLLRTGPHTRRRDRCTLWAAFALGIAVSPGRQHRRRARRSSRAARSGCGNQQIEHASARVITGGPRLDRRSASAHPTLAAELGPDVVGVEMVEVGEDAQARPATRREQQWHRRSARRGRPRPAGRRARP
jgi:hypothetical protein